MTMRSKQWYTKTSRLEYSFAKSSIGRRSSDRVLTTRSSVRRPVESKFQICLASPSRQIRIGVSTAPQWPKMLSKTFAKDFLFLASTIKLGDDFGFRLSKITAAVTDSGQGTYGRHPDRQGDGTAD